MTDEQMTDEQIACLVQTGDIEAFGLIVERYGEKLKRYGHRFLSGDLPAIEDAVQECFLKAYQNIFSFDLSKKFSSWIYRIAHNEFVNLLRKKKPLSFFSTDIFFPHPVSGETAQKGADFRESRELVENCLSRLDPKYSEVLLLYYLEDLSYQEIADILHIPLATVGVRLKRGREAAKCVCEGLGYKHKE